MRLAISFLMSMVDWCSGTGLGIAGEGGTPKKQFTTTGFRPDFWCVWNDNRSACWSKFLKDIEVVMLVMEFDSLGGGWLVIRGFKDRTPLLAAVNSVIYM